MIKVSFFYITIFLFLGCSSTEESEDTTLENNNKNIDQSVSSNQSPDYRETIEFINAEAFFEDGARKNLDGLYSRIILENKLTKNECKQECQIDLLNYNKRSFISRFFWDSRNSVTASANLDVHFYNSVIPLLTISEVSSSEIGEKWERKKLYSKGNEPLFLIASGSKNGSLKFNFRGTEEKNFDVSKVIDVAISSIGMISPQAQLLTSLNKRNFNEKAQAIDSAISNSFSENLSEIIELNIRLDSWHKNDKYKLTMLLPSNKTDWEEEEDLVKTGIWELKLSTPRISAFYSDTICKNTDCTEYLNMKEATEKIYSKYKENKDFFKVLDTPLYQINDIDKISINDEVSKISAVQNLSDSNYLIALDQKELDKTNLNNIDKACRDIGRKAASLGFSSIDTTLIIYSSFMANPLIKVPSDKWIQKIDYMPSCHSFLKELIEMNP